MRPRLEPWSLSARLIALSLVATLIGTSIGGWMLRERLHAAVERGFEAQLRDRAERLAIDLESLGVHAARGNRLQQGEFGRIFSGWYWVVQQAGATHQSRSGWDGTLAVAQARALSARSRLLRLADPTGRALLGIAQPLRLDGQAATVYVFGPMEETLQEWQRIDRILLSTQLGLLLALALLTVLMVRFGLRPLRRLQQRLALIQRGQARQLGPGHGPDLDPVAAAIDQMIERNARVVERAQHQAADLSHALKKPLAVLGIEARKAAVPGPWLQDQVRAMSHTVDRHLARFGGGAGSAEPIDLRAVLARLVTLMEKIHHDKGLHWGIVWPETEGLRWRGATSDFEEMVGNLLDNAGKWAHTLVRISVLRQGGEATFYIDDDGTGLSAEQLAQSAERGRRFDEGVAGHGMGLAIVRDIAETYDSQLELGRSDLGGLRCVLRLHAI